MNNETKFIDTSHECKKLMVKLSKEALKDGGKVITKILRDTVPVRTGGLKKSIRAWAKINYKTGQPYMEVGYLNRAQMKKKGFKYMVNPIWFEFGTKPHKIMTNQLKNNKPTTYMLSNTKVNFGYTVKHPGMVNKNFLRNTVMNNIDAINKAQKEKLSQLTDIIIQQGASIDLGKDEEIE